MTKKSFSLCGTNYVNVIFIEKLITLGTSTKISQTEYQNILDCIPKYSDHVSKYFRLRSKIFSQVIS